MSSERAPRDTATFVRLEPLDGGAAADLIRALPGGSAIPSPLSERILAAAEGNPLFVEEFVGLLRDDGSLVSDPATGAWSASEGLDDLQVPASIQALLAARLEGLPEPERTVAQRASVIGRSATSSAIVASLPEHEIGRRDQQGEGDEVDRFLAALERQMVPYIRDKTVHDDTPGQYTEFSIRV